MLFLGEEDHPEISRRLSAASMHYRFDPAVVSRLVKAFPAAGVDLRLTREMNGSLDASALVQNVISLAEQHAQACGDPVRLIVFDHARLVMDGDPDDSANVTQLTRVLTQIAQATGAAVFLLAHSPKTVLTWRVLVLFRTTPERASSCTGCGTMMLNHFKFQILTAKSTSSLNALKPTMAPKVRNGGLKR